MSRVFGLVFKYINDIHYIEYDGEQKFALDDLIIARTVRSKEIGRIIHERRELPKRDSEPFVRKIIRKATEKDFQREEANREREKKAFSIAIKKIKKLDLPMTLIRVHYLFDHSRILFYFKAAGKVDFRQLVRELASVFKARIELRQIGVRDEAKMLGGIASCGRPLCCATWLRSFTPVTVRMAKDQHLSLNPNKISGLCGRLQCCLEYEQKFYEETLKGVPSMGSHVSSSQGEGKLIKANIFNGTGNVLLQDSSIVTVSLDDVRQKPRQRKDRGKREKEQDSKEVPESRKKGRRQDSKATKREDSKAEPQEGKDKKSKKRPNRKRRKRNRKRNPNSESKSSSRDKCSEKK